MPSFDIRPLLANGCWTRDNRTTRTGARQCLNAKMFRIEPRESLSAAEELGSRQQSHQRFGEEEDHHHIDQCRQAERERESLTDPMASTNKTSADSNETVSAIKIVCRALRQPVSTAVRRLRPSRTSSRIRSRKSRSCLR